MDEVDGCPLGTSFDSFEELDAHAHETHDARAEWRQLDTDPTKEELVFVQDFS